MKHLSPRREEKAERQTFLEDEMGKHSNNYWAFTSLAELEKLEAGILGLIEMSLRIGRLNGVPGFEIQLADIRERMQAMRASEFPHGFRS